MFDDILKAVKDHFAENPQIAAAIPADQHDAVHNEIASHISNNVAAGQDAAGTGGLSGLLGKLQTEIGSNNPIVNAISGGLVSSLASKFGLGSAASGAIAASLPALLQKLAPKQSAPTA